MDVEFKKAHQESDVQLIEQKEMLVKPERIKLQCLIVSIRTILSLSLTF